MIKEAVQALVEDKTLSRSDAYEVFIDIMSGDATPVQIGSFLTALRIRSETSDVIAGAVQAMREKLTPVKTPAEITVDIVGTGGDGFNTFNISTAAAFVVAGTGVTVAKHGSRGVSSRCGSADVLKELGVDLTVSEAVMEKCLNEIGIAFLFAPSLHPAMKYATGPRKDLGFWTLFNILGPLANPAGAQHGVIGAFSGRLAAQLAEALSMLGAKHLFVVSGDDGLDEITTTTTTQVWEVKGSIIRQFTINPDELGLPRAEVADLGGGEPNENAAIIRALFAGTKGPKRDILLLNSAAALVSAGKVADLKAGIALAAKSIDSGAAQAKLDALVSAC